MTPYTYIMAHFVEAYNVTQSYTLSMYYATLLKKHAIKVIYYYTLYCSVWRLILRVIYYLCGTIYIYYAYGTLYVAYNVTQSYILSMYYATLLGNM